MSIEKIFSDILLNQNSAKEMSILKSSIDYTKSGTFKSILNKNLINKVLPKNDKIKNLSSNIDISNQAIRNKFELQKKVEAAINKLAGFFKVGPNLMLEIIKSLGFNPEDLTNQFMNQHIAKKLCEFFNLNKKDSEELFKLFKQF